MILCSEYINLSIAYTTIIKFNILFSLLDLDIRSIANNYMLEEGYYFINNKENVSIYFFIY